MLRLKIHKHFFVHCWSNLLLQSVQLSIILQLHFFYLKYKYFQLSIIVYNRAVIIILHSNTFLLKSDPQVLLKILIHKRYSNWPTGITQILIHKRYSKLVIYKRCSKLVVHECYWKLFKIFANVTQINQQTLLKLTHECNSELLNISFKLTHKCYSKLRYSKLLKICFKLTHKRYSN